MKGRSPLWWKSGRVLAWVWVLGSLLVAGATLPFLYQQWVEVRELVTRYQAMSAYVETHRETLESSDLSDPPTPDALAILADKVPPDRDVSRLLLQLRDAAEAAGVKLNAVRVADEPEELDRLFDEKEENREAVRFEERKTAGGDVWEAVGDSPCGTGLAGGLSISGNPRAEEVVPSTSPTAPDRLRPGMGASVGKSAGIRECPNSPSNLCVSRSRTEGALAEASAGDFPGAGRSPSGSAPKMKRRAARLAPESGKDLSVLSFLSKHT